MGESALATKGQSPAQQLAAIDRSVSSRLRVADNNVCWFLYIDQGELLYATNSVDSFERLDRHLRVLGHLFPSLTSDVRTEVRLVFEAENNTTTDLAPEYHAIRWLVNKGYLTEPGAQQLTRQMSLEVLESYLLLPEGDYRIAQQAMYDAPEYRAGELTTLITTAEERLSQWQRLDRISSPYQRLYLLGAEMIRQKFSPEMSRVLEQLLRGFNFWQIGTLLNQEPIVVAQRLASLIADGHVILRDPIHPFDRLPLLSNRAVSATAAPQPEAPIVFEDWPSLPSQGGTEKRVWKIACIDDSQAMLGEIQRFLDGDEFSVTPINDAMKALMKIGMVKPDLVLLDVGMPGIDGYQVCTLIRKSSALKHIPIVMVTGHKGLIDRARARVAGATDYLTKPFNQDDLLKMVFRYLS
jgi:two-component system, chemotaxis family, response regulator PixG